MNIYCTEISTINQFKNSVFVFYLSRQKVIQQLLRKKLSLALVKAKIVRFLANLNIEDGINSKDMAFEYYGGRISDRGCGRYKLAPWKFFLRAARFLAKIEAILIMRNPKSCCKK